MPRDAKMCSDILNNLRRVFQVLIEQSKKAEESTGLTGPQLWALKEIAAAGSLSGVELAKRMFVHPVTIVTLVDRLEARALVTRVRSKVDRRVVDIELTREGVALVQNAPEVAQDVLIKGLDKLPDNKVLQIAEGLQNLVEVLGTENTPPKMIMSQEKESIMSSIRRASALTSEK